MSDPTEKMANDVAKGIENAPVLHELDDDESVELSLNYVKGSTFGEGLTIGFHLSNHNVENLHKAVTGVVEPKLDKRTFRVAEDRRGGKSWKIGTIEINKSGELVDYEIDEQYLKPTER